MTHKFNTLAMLALAALTLTMTSCQKEDPIVGTPSETTKTSTESSAKTKAIVNIFQNENGNYCAQATGGNLEESPMTLSFTLTFYAVYNGYAKTESRSMTTERIRFNDNSVHYLARQRDCENDCINWLKNNVRPSYPQDGGWKFTIVPYITINGDVDENVVIDNAFNQKYPFNM